MLWSYPKQIRISITCNLQYPWPDLARRSCSMPLTQPGCRRSMRSMAGQRQTGLLAEDTVKREFFVWNTAIIMNRHFTHLHSGDSQKKCILNAFLRAVLPRRGLGGISGQKWWSKNLWPPKKLDFFPLLGNLADKYECFEPILANVHPWWWQKC